MSAGITVTGLTEFRGALEDLENRLPEARNSALAGCSDLVLVDARRRVPTRSGRARSSLAVKVLESSATVVGGGPRAPYFPWLDFGGSVGRRHSVHRPYLANGRYVYFAHQGVQARYGEILADALADAVNAAGLEST